MTQSAPQHNASSLLQVRDLSVEFQNGGETSRVVDRLSFDLEANKTLAIVGESGSGKSVTSLALLGLLPSVGGRVAGGSALFQSAILGQTVDLASLEVDRLRIIRGNEIAMIFQEPMTSLNPVFTLGSQITEAIMLHQKISHAEAFKQAEQLFDLVRLPNARRMLSSYPHQISGGMRQRAMIAMALSCRPKILVADEPTTALDVTIQAQILYIIRDLQAELQMAVIFISHDMGVVSEMANDILVMRAGQAVETGSAEDILLHPQADYTKALLAAVPRIGSMTGEPYPRRFDLLTDDPSDVPAPSEKLVPSDTPVIEVSELTTRYDIRGGLLNRVTHRVHAVENLSFEIRQGETLALVGESGCGKSTVGKTIQQLVDPVSGHIRFHGQDIFSLPPAQRQRFRRDIQYVFQDPYGSLNPRKTIGASIAEPAKTHGIISRNQGSALVGKLLTQVGLDEAMAERYPHEFSGGQRQRICIARALACNPSLIIADEAVSALDVSVQAQVVNLLMDLQAERGLAYLFITHDMAVVERVSHRVAVMYLGQLLEIGTRQQIFENPQHEYTKRLLDAVPVVDPLRKRHQAPLEGEIPSPIRPVGDDIKINHFENVGNGHLVAV